MSDFAWAGAGGVIMDGTGDIAVSSGFAELQDLVVTRLKASQEDWQMYSLGADLESRIGSTTSAATQTKIQQQIAQALSDILPSSAYQISTLAVANTIQVYVFVQGTVMVTASISPDSLQITGN